MNKPTIKSLTEQLAEEKRLRRQAEDANISLQSKIAGSPTLQDKLNMANATVADLMKEVETLKKDRDNFERNFNNVNECYEGVYDNYEKLKSDYALLEEKYYTQADNYTELNKMHDALLSQFNKNLDQHRAIEAENHALKAEIERTNRHINLAENQLHKEQQPTVINYHNCTFNN